MASGTEEAGSFHLSPNPTSGTCLVRLYSNAPARITVLDASGRVVQELATATDAMLLDVARLDQGCYTVCVAQNGVQRTQRLVVY
ncbi:MAG: T9SS type A sorting domain-containing protein [Flavobacteriales bacterium]|nr:T9SS type A sorting domain-containing protein [Flavobacteriales bacterium]